MKKIKFTIKQVIYCLSLIVFLSNLSNAQDLNEKLPQDPNVATGKLPNGLTYYIRNNHKPANKIEMRLVVKTGSILEEDDQLGLAHFMEHMNFNGTKNFEKNELVSFLQTIGVSFGADLNAYTSFDQTVYILPIPTDKPSNIDKGFQIIEDWAHNATLADQDIDDERGVVLEEFRLGTGAEDRMRKIFFPKLVDGSLYAERLPIGKEDILKKFKYDKIRDFYKDWYRPDLQAVVIVGDIDTTVAKDKIIAHFSKIANPKPAKRRKYETVRPRSEPDAMVVKDVEATNTSLFIFYPFAKKHDIMTTTDYRNFLIRNLVEIMINRRLTEISQDNNPPFPFAGENYTDLIHGYECVTFAAGFTNDGLEKAVNALTAEILKFKKFGFTESELDMAKKEALSEISKSYNERSTTESANYVEEYISNFLDNSPYPGIETEYNLGKSLVPEVKLTEANSMVKSMLSSKNTFTLIKAPDKKGIELPNNKSLLVMADEGFKQNVSATNEVKLAASLISKPPVPGRVITTKKEDALNATTYTLSNGIKVTIKSTDFKSDEILLNGVKKGGSNNYDVVDRSNAHFAADVVEGMGVGEFTPNILNKMLAGKNIGLKMSVGEIEDRITANSTVKDFETLLQLMYLYITSPRKDEGLFSAYKEREIAKWQNIISSPMAAFVDTAIKTLYDNNPLTKFTFPKPNDYDRINLDRTLEIYKNEFSGADGYHFFISGNIKPDVVIPMIETYIGSIPAYNLQAVFKDNGVRPISGEHQFKFNKGKEKQSMILEVFTGQAPYSEDFALKVSALAEILNIKVIEDLREKMGGIYAGGFMGRVSKEPYSKYTVQLQLPCGPENVDKLISAADDEIKNIIANGPDSKNLDKVKSQWHEKYVVDVKENKFWTEKLESVLFWNRDADRIVNYENYVQKLTPSDIQNTAKKVFSGNTKFVAVLNPE